MCQDDSKTVITDGLFVPSLTNTFVAIITNRMELVILKMTNTLLMIEDSSTFGMDIIAKMFIGVQNTALHSPKLVIGASECLYIAKGSCLFSVSYKEDETLSVTRIDECSEWCFASGSKWTAFAYVQHHKLGRCCVLGYSNGQITMASLKEFLENRKPSLNEKLKLNYSITCLLHPHSYNSCIDENTLISGSSDFAIRVWDIGDLSIPKKTIHIHCECISGLFMAPGSIKYICSIDQNGSVALIDLSTNLCVLFIRGGGCPRLTNLYWNLKQAHLCALYTDQTVHVYEMDSGHCHSILTGETAKNALLNEGLYRTDLRLVNRIDRWCAQTKVPEGLLLHFTHFRLSGLVCVLMSVDMRGLCQQLHSVTHDDDSMSELNLAITNAFEQTTQFTLSYQGIPNDRSLLTHTNNRTLAFTHPVQPSLNCLISLLPGQQLTSTSNANVGMESGPVITTLSLVNMLSTQMCRLPASKQNESYKFNNAIDATNSGDE
ncbi:hypothetical protein ACOME3_000951 [Neoechinorhynchus agilis]